MSAELLAYLLSAGLTVTTILFGKLYVKYKQKVNTLLTEISELIGKYKQAMNDDKLSAVELKELMKEAVDVYEAVKGFKD